MMNEFKGTPGRFFAQSEELESGDVSVCVCDQYGNSIAFCGRSLGLPERNAELFAAAPELLEALQLIIKDLRVRAKVRGDIDDDGTVVLDVGSGALMKANDAIAKALGAK